MHAGSEGPACRPQHKASQKIPCCRANGSPRAQVHAGGEGPASGCRHKASQNTFFAIGLMAARARRCTPAVKGLLVGSGALLAPLMDCLRLLAAC